MNGEDLKKARKALCMTQRELAAALRLSPKNGDSIIRKWEAGREISGPAQVAIGYMLAEIEVPLRPKKPT